MAASSRMVKHRSSRASGVSLMPRMRTPWLRIERTPASCISRVAWATEGVTDWALLMCVWTASPTPRQAAVQETRPRPSTTSGADQCWGRPMSALVASRMSRMLSISSRRMRKDSRFFHGMLATSPPETTTSRTCGDPLR